MFTAFLIRLGRTSTAFFTVWSLGCTGFGPILTALTDHPDAVPCESMAMDRAATASATHALEHTTGSQPGAADQPSHADCSSPQSCAATPRPALTAPIPIVIPFVVSADAVQPLSIARRPAIPPPERTTA